MERGDNRVQLKSLMDSPSVASEMRDRTGMRSEFPLTSPKQSKVSHSPVSLSLSLCLYSYVVSEHYYVVNEAGAAVARPGKVVGSVLRYNNCGAATGVEALEQQQRRMVRNPVGVAQYPKRSSQPCKSSRGDEDCDSAEGSSRLKQNPQYLPQKVAAAQDTAMSRWY